MSLSLVHKCVKYLFKRVAKHCVFLIVAAFVLQLSALAEESRYQQGVKAYGQGKYAQAISLLNSCTAGSGSQIELAHYYLGLSYQGINQKKQACGQFDWILANSRNQPLRNYATTGLQNLLVASGGTAPRVASAVTTTSTTSTVATASTVAAKASGAATSMGRCSSDPKSYFLYSGDTKSLGEVGHLADCGPISLMMIFRAYNKYPPNFQNLDLHQMKVNTRLAMTGQSQSVITTMEQICKGASSAGLKTSRFDGLETLDSWLKQRVLVVALLAPTGPGCYGEGSDVYNGTPSDSGHYVVITGVTNGVYHVSDMNYAEPLELSKAQMLPCINGSGFNGRYQDRCVAIGL